tara:strand:+ start:202 stop:546 length:345 start_codon:yes stop_codon:yes gene_type:complete
MDKKDVINIIKEWVILDKKIKQLQHNISIERKAKKSLTEKLSLVMKDNDIDEFDINKGKLVYTRSKTRAPLSKKHLLNSLSEFYKEDEGMVEELTKFIMESREEIYKDIIKHKE